MRWFGRPWGPWCERAPQVATPVGLPCVGDCGGQIGEEDSGAVLVDLGEEAVARLLGDLAGRAAGRRPGPGEELTGGPLNVALEVRMLPLHHGCLLRLLTPSWLWADSVAAAARPGNTAHVWART